MKEWDPNWVHIVRAVLTDVWILPETKLAALREFDKFYEASKAKTTTNHTHKQKGE